MAIASRDKGANSIGQALSAIALGITPGNSRKTPSLACLDGGSMVKERLAGVQSDFLQPPQSSEYALRTADNTPRSRLGSRLDRRVVKERIHEGKMFNFLPPEGRRTALRTRTTHRKPRACGVAMAPGKSGRFRTSDL